MTVTVSSTPTRRTNKPAAKGLSSSREPRGKKGKKDNSGLENDLVQYLVDYHVKYDTRPLFKSEHLVRKRLRSKVARQAAKVSQIKRAHLLNNIADSVVTVAIKQGHINITKVNGMFTSEVAT